MPLKSMTGFGRAESQWETWSLRAEVKSLNHRFLEIIPRLPKRYQALEERLRRLIRERFSRGRFEVYLQITGSPPEAAALSINHSLAEQYFRALNLLKTQFHLSGEVAVGDLLRMREVFATVETEEDLEKLWQEVSPVLEEALSELMEMRLKEGSFLEEVIRAQLEELKRLLSEIKALKERVFQENRRKLEERIKRLLADQSLDPVRLHQEVVFLADRTDFTEEMDRLESHLMQFEKALLSEGPVGRKLDFLIQEMNREVNTIGAKALDSLISMLIVDIKGEMEKIREQIQNIE